MATQLHTTTADELLAMPRDGVRRELVDGEVREMPPAGHRQGRVAMRVSTPLHHFVTSGRLGEVYAAETGFRLASDPDTVRAPDVAFVRAERVEEAGDPESYFPGAPDLAVEVISPTDRYSDVLAKVGDYLNAGTRRVVLVDPQNRTVSVFAADGERADLTEGDVLDGGDVVPGWTLPVRDIFA